MQLASITNNLIYRLSHVILCLSMLTIPASPQNQILPDSETDTSSAVMVMDIRPGKEGSLPKGLIAVEDTLFFQANDGVHGAELWKSVPPYTSASMVQDIRRYGGSAPEGFILLGTTLFFRATDSEHGKELWRMEAPYQHAELVSDLWEGEESADPQELTVLGDALFFRADDGIHGKELWMLTSPYRTPVLVTDLFSGGGSSNPADLTVIAWTLFFSADDSSGREVWKLESPYTAATAKRVGRVNYDGSADPEEFTPIGLKLFFSANDDTGREVWMSEPPYETVRRVNDIDHKKPSNPIRLMAAGDTLFFVATVGTSGYELRKCEPPYNSTTLYRVADINPRMKDSDPKNIMVAGTSLLFAADDGALGVELWRTGPPFTEADIVSDLQKGPKGSNPETLAVIGKTLYFAARNGEYGRELWKSEPPYTEVSLVSNLWDDSGSSLPSQLTTIKNTTFFVANDGRKGRELWKLQGDVLPSTGFAPDRVTRVEGSRAESGLAQMDGDLRLEIPGLNVTRTIVGVPNSGNSWNLNWLGDDLGYLDGTAYPTWNGNTVITGHSYLSDGTTGPLFGLGGLKKGDWIFLHAWGQRYTYAIREVYRTTAQDDRPLRHEDEDWITLITCSNYDASQDRYRSRIVVRAVRVAATAEPAN